MIDTGYIGQGAANQAAVPQTTQRPSLEEPLVLRSAFQNRPDLGLCIMLVRGTDAVAKCFSITLVKNASSVTVARGESTTPVPFNPTLPSIPSMPVGALPPLTDTPNNLPKPAAPQSVLMPQQLPAAAAASVNGSAATFSNGMLANNVAAPVVHLAQAPALNALSVPQAGVPPSQMTVPQAPLTAPAPSFAIPQATATTANATGATAFNSQQLMQLILLSQQQQQIAQGQQQQQASSPTAQNVQQPSVFPAAQQLQQYPQQLSQLNQIPAQLQANGPAVAAVPAYWNAQNLAMLPQFQQMFKPPGSSTNGSSQGDNPDENEDNGPAYYASG
jgi:hypothetical protein